MHLNGSILRLDHLLLLQAQTATLLYSPDAEEAAEAVRDIVDLSSRMLGTSTSQQWEAKSDNEPQGVPWIEETGSVESATECGEVSLCVADSVSSV